MYCKRYRADIPEVTCIARQERAKGKRWRSSDPGCRKCPQGQQLLLSKTQEKAVEKSQPSGLDIYPVGTINQFARLEVKHA
jgi:hypothetical protein